jgi:hypothetical protein
MVVITAALAVAACDRDRNHDDRERRPAPAAPTTSQGITTLKHPTEDTTAPDWKAVDQAMGLTGKAQPGGVYKYSFPRSDLQVRIGDVAVKPALALGGWVAFKGAGRDAMGMGDLVLRESEVVPVMTKLQAMGVRQTALHNHLEGESPRVIYMHVEGRGDPVKMAQAVHGALALTKIPAVAPTGASTSSTAIGIDTAQIAQVLGHGGSMNGGVYQVSVPRTETITADGMEVPPAMGVATAINFQPTGDAKAAATGDFVLIGSEVTPVLRALRDNDIAVTALHSHMLTETPRLFFAHFWANEDALKLAHGLRAALDQTTARK